MTKSEKKPKTIGIIGGMGPFAGVELHKRIITLTKACSDQDHHNVIHLSFSSQIGDRTDYLSGKIQYNPGIEIAKQIEIAKDLGAQSFVVACNTAHSPKILQHFEQARLVHLIRSCAHFCSKEKIESVGVISTNGTLESALYQNELSNLKIQSSQLSFENNDQFIHRAIYDADFGLKAIGSNSKAIDLVIQGIQKLGSDSIILGCTELSFIKDELESQLNEITFIDPLDCVALDLIN